MGILAPDVQEFVRKEKLAFVATTCPDGTPNLSPKGTTIVWDDDHLVFADIHSPGTVENLLRNPSIEINVVDFFIRKGYRFKGVATVYSEGQTFDEVIAFYRKAGSKHSIKNIVLIKVEHVSPVWSPAYDIGLTEEDVKERWREYWNGLYPSK